MTVVISAPIAEGGWLGERSAGASWALLHACLARAAVGQYPTDRPTAHGGIDGIGRGEVLSRHRFADQIALRFLTAESAQEIELIARFDAAEIAPDAAALATLRDFLAIRAPLNAAAGALSDFADANRLDLSGAIADFAERESEMDRAGVDTAAVFYDAAFGRALDYYTALVYEITLPDGLVLVGGGRYDRLLTMLGAKTAMPGVGFSVWLDRIEALRGEIR